RIAMVLSPSSATYDGIGSSAASVVRPLEEPEERDDPPHAGAHQCHRAPDQLEADLPEDVPGEETGGSADDDTDDPRENERPPTHGFHGCLHAARLNPCGNETRATSSDASTGSIAVTERGAHQNLGVSRLACVLVRALPRSVNSRVRSSRPPSSTT